jgi:hypothetical protein
MERQAEISFSDLLARAIRILAIVAAAVVVGGAVSVGAAMLGHEVLVLKVGEEGIPAIDDRPLMFAFVAGAYLAGGLSGLAVVVFGWRRYFRRKT